MLDSTGLNGRESVDCFLCNGNELKFEVYKPEVGHMGEALNLPYCMSPHGEEIENISGARFFQINPYDKYSPQVAENGYPTPVFFEEVNLNRSLDPYHYRGYLLPDFGSNVGQVVYVCNACTVSRSGDLLQSLSEFFYKEANLQLGLFLGYIFNSGLFLVSRELAGRKFKRLKEYERGHIMKCFKQVFHNVSSMEPTESNSAFLRELKKLEKVFS